MKNPPLKYGAALEGWRVLRLTELQITAPMIERIKFEEVIVHDEKFVEEVRFERSAMRYAYPSDTSITGLLLVPCVWPLRLAAM